MTIALDDLTFFADLLRRHSAISVGPDKEYLVQSRLAPIAREYKLGDTTALIGELRRPVPSRDLLDRVIDAMTTNETSFFRDQRPFDALVDHVLPSVIERNAATRRLRIWSAASSTGQELYSIAMLLEEKFPELSGWDVTLHGTDLSADVVGRAQAGRFSALEVGRGMPDKLLARYFKGEGNGYVIDEQLRRRCTFERMNLAEPWNHLPTFDVIFCRNVLIYFEPEVKIAIMRRIRRSLNAGGFFLLGSSETTMGLADEFSGSTICGTTVYRAV